MFVRADVSGGHLLIKLPYMGLSLILCPASLTINPLHKRWHGLIKTGCNSGYDGSTEG